MSMIEELKFFLSILINQCKDGVCTPKNFWRTST